MKKILSILLVAALATPMFAEKMTPEERGNADYSTWLPAKGEFSLGFSVDPFANFVGKMFNSAGAANYNREIGGDALTNNAFALSNPVVSLMGSYMLTDKLALKANVGFIVNYTKWSGNVLDDAARFENPYSMKQVQDVAKLGEYGGSFAFGAEYRIGKRRVQGVFGGGLMYAFQTHNETYSYGNAITEMNQKPTSTHASYVSVIPGVIDNARLINNAVDMSGDMSLWHRIGLYTSAGVEVFLAPKVALGMNVNLDLLYKWSSNVCKQYEGYNLLTKQVETFTDTRNIDNYSGVTFSTENIGANLYLNFWF